MEDRLRSEALMRKLSATYKTIASPLHCPLCGALPREPLDMEPNKVIRCWHCQKDYVLKISLEEDTINQIITAILQDFSDVVTEEIKKNLGQMVAFYHQNLVEKMHQILQNQNALTISAIQNAYNTVDQHMLLILENIQKKEEGLKSDMKQLSRQQEVLLDKSQEHYQVLLQQTQLIVSLIRQINSSNIYNRCIQPIEDKPKRKLKDTDFSPEEFAPI